MLKRKKAPFILIWAVIANLLISATLSAQQVAEQSKKTQVMVLGTYHFDNPGVDYIKSSLDDHLSEKRQKQILEVVELIAKFKPTKIALEDLDGVRQQQNYEAYLRGEYTLKASETHQLGFRLAKQFNHQKVYAVDHQLGMNLESVIAAAKQNGDRRFLGMFQQVMAEVQEFDKRKLTMTVREILAEYNQQKNIVREENMYLQISRVRNDKDFVGADVLTGWYQRNFRIFTNLAGIIEPTDRVLVIFGEGHLPTLRRLVQSSQDMQLVEANDYLLKR